MSKRQLYLTALITPYVLAQSLSIIPAPGQPSHKGDPGKFELIGNSIVSGQQAFVGNSNKVYLLDKVQNNPTQINGHPAWASEYRLSDNNQRPMDVRTNTFCAGGNVLGNGTWLNVGGNQAVTQGGIQADQQDGSSGPYRDADGRRSMRLLNPCDNDDCRWFMSPFESEQRWYPTLETLEDGTIIILGGCRWGGYINDQAQDNPTYEFFPPNGPPVLSRLLQNTLPANLYPLTWLLPSGKLLIQSTLATALLDYRTHNETPLDPMPDAIRTYPASAGNVMLPLSPANNYTATIMFCGGTNVTPDTLASSDFVPISLRASTSCVKITPDVSKSYQHDDPLPVERSMTNFVLLPDGKILCLNGARTGTAGYGNTSWARGQSFADDPVLMPVLYNPDAPSGSRWSSNGFSPSTVPRMYHSSATLLPDGSVFVTGSNPNADYNVGPEVLFPTEYRTERFYPLYYNERRPQPKGLVSQLSYGGSPFDVVLDSDDLFSDIINIRNTTVILLRPGFSTHSMNMGQRMLILRSSYTGFTNNTATLHVSQLPPNPSAFPPGPAFLFVVVKGIPSVGVQIMVGSGSLGAQPIQSISSIPESTIRSDPGSNSSSNNQNNPQASFAETRYLLPLDVFEGWSGIAAIMPVVLLSTLGFGI